MVFNHNLGDIFLKCSPHPDSTFCGIDTVFCLDSGEKITVLIEFVNGHKIRATGFYNNGQKYRETNFNGYDRNGTDIKWYKNGAINWYMYLKDGRMSFPYFSFHLNGMLERYCDYDRKLNREFEKVWQPNGILSQETISIDSTEDGWIVKDYYESGNLSRIANYNVPRGYWVEYYENGKIGLEGYIENTQFCQIGRWREWHENGQLNREYYFKTDTPNVPDSTWSWWDIDGKLIKQESYKDGKLVKQKVFIKEKEE